MMEQERLLGLDVGARRIGVSLSDPLGLTAQRLMVLERRTLEQDLHTVAALVNEHGVKTVVVGLPITMQGAMGEQAQWVMTFVEALRHTVSCPVQVMDERLTTVQGERSLPATDTPRKRRKQLIDQVAAQLILQAYLETHHHVQHTRQEPLTTYPPGRAGLKRPPPQE